MKTRKIAFTFILLLAIGLFILFKSPNKQEKKQVIQSKKRETSTVTNTILKIEEKTVKKLNDTTLYLYFDELSDVYNYRIIDKFYANNSSRNYDSLVRIIKVFEKNDSLIQTIIPKLYLNADWYYFDREKPKKLVRSYITGENTQTKVVNNYMAHLIIADLNFDGLEDFATPIDHGADNGPHHAFYIQQKSGKFRYNQYLSNELIWFPEKFNDSLKTFTRIMAAGAWGIGYTTFKYDTIRNKWKIIKNYQIDLETGKVVK